MKRLLYATTALAAFVMFISTSSAGAQQPQRSVSEVVKATVDSVVLIVISDESGKPIAEGSGFTTTGTLILRFSKFPGKTFRLCN